MFEMKNEKRSKVNGMKLESNQLIEIVREFVTERGKVGHFREYNLRIFPVTT